MREAPEIARVGIEALDALSEVESRSAAWPWAPEALRSSLERPTTRAWLATVGGQPTGLLVASVVADVGEVLDVAVLPEARRLGLGRRLLDTCQATFRSEGVVEAFLEVRVGNAPAIALYRGAGWAPVSTRRRYYPDGEDALVMRWEAAC